MNWPVRLLALVCLLLGPGIAPAPGAADPIDLTGATVVASPATGATDDDRLLASAARMLVEEVRARSRCAWTRVAAWSEAPARTPLIVVARESDVARLAGPDVAPPTLARTRQPEGFRLVTGQHGARPVVWVLGEDARGTLFGVGRLLRMLRLERDRVTLPGGLALASAPRYPLRGHQLGYRAKTNSYDGWTVAMWEQYFRDLIVFGCNAVELIPPRTDDDLDSPHFPLPPLAMMTAMARLAADYGLQVWVWFPAMDAHYEDPAVVAASLKEWAEVFAALPRVDAVFVPGGDPGHTPPGPLFALLEQQAANLKQHHPRATLWLSPQGFDGPAFDDVMRRVQAEPAWLDGLVFGPQVRLDLPEFRRAVPGRYPIRFYPDITHSRTCQYPVPDWDRVFPLTEGREVINPRPVDQAAIVRGLSPLTCGFLTYSEGCNDDVNKAVWSALGWDPDADLTAVLRDFGRYFIHPDLADDFAQALLALERNWRGPIGTNTGIETTLAQFQALERRATPAVKQNWRFQQAVYRAYYDGMLRRRYLDEQAAEVRALEALGSAGSVGSLVALDRGETILHAALQNRPGAELRARCGELAEALFQSIRMQLDVDRYLGQPGRGTSQTTIDRALNDAPYLLQQCAAIGALPDEPTRLARIDALVHRHDPGPGGFYDDLGNPSQQPHLVRGPAHADDPASRRGPLVHFDGTVEMPGSWFDQVIGLYEQPIVLSYQGLDPAARYRVRAVYSLGPTTLTADGLPVHPPLDRRYEPVEFEIPPEATADGALTLTFQGPTGRGGNGRTVGVAEVFLLKTTP